jgi:hypothetical protein
MLDDIKRRSTTNRSRNMVIAGGNLFKPYNKWGTWWRIWLKHCSTSRKVAGSIPDGVILIFHLHIPSGCTVFDLWVDSASNRNEYHQNLPGSKDGCCVGLPTLPSSCLEIWESQPPETVRAWISLNMDCFMLFTFGRVRLLLCWYSWTHVCPTAFCKELP